MDTQVLIDSIVRQTTVLIAQLSSAAGVRAPLAHLADEVFLNLSRELEQQGLSKKVVADMFGLALRGYQRRVQRLSESVTQRGTTLWQAVVELIEKEGPVDRRRVFERFRHDDAAAVGAVLSDLANSGIISRKGQGDDTVFRLTPEKERAVNTERQNLETTSTLVWLELCRNPDASADELATQLALPPTRIESALAELLREGRVQRVNGELVIEPLVVPVGAEKGWEVAIFDHYQTMCVALGTKLARRGRPVHHDTTGGQTLSFEIDDEHPEKDAVLALLEETRTRANELWHRVEKHNSAHARDDRRRVSFYVGQVEIGGKEDLE